MTKAEREANQRQRVKEEWQIITGTKRLLDREPADVVFAVIDMWQQQRMTLGERDLRARWLDLRISLAYEAIEARIREQGSS